MTISTLKDVKRELRLNKVAIIDRVRQVYTPWQEQIGTCLQTKKDVSEFESDNPRITSVDDTHVAGYWIRETFSWDSETSTTSAHATDVYDTFCVKHDGKKFQFGGGSSSGTWTLYFKNLRKTVD